MSEDIREEWRDLDRRITAFDDEFAARAKTDEAARRLATIPNSPTERDICDFRGV
jgi:transposase